MVLDKIYINIIKGKKIYENIRKYEKIYENIRKYTKTIKIFIIDLLKKIHTTMEVNLKHLKKQ